MKKNILLVIVCLLVGFCCRQAAAEAVYENDQITSWTNVGVNCFTGDLSVAVDKLVKYGYITAEVGQLLKDKIESNDYFVEEIGHGQLYNVLISGDYDLEEHKETNWKDHSYLPVRAYQVVKDGVVYKVHEYYWNCTNVGYFAFQYEGEEEEIVGGKTLICYLTVVSSPEMWQVQEQNVTVSVNNQVAVNTGGGGGGGHLNGYIVESSRYYGSGGVYFYSPSNFSNVTNITNNCNNIPDPQTPGCGPAPPGGIQEPNYKYIKYGN